MKRLSPEQKVQIRQKIITFNLLSGKKPWKTDRKFEGDYLSNDERYKNNLAQFIQKESKKESKSVKVLFSSVVQKCNRKGKGEIRLIVLTEDKVHVVHENFSSKKPARMYSEITGISVTDKKDPLVVIHVTGGADFVLDLAVASGETTMYQGEKVSELITVMYQAWTNKNGKSSNLPINVHPSKIQVKFPSGDFETTVVGSTDNLNKGTEGVQMLFRISKQQLIASSSII